MQFLVALFHDPLVIRKWHCRDAPYSALAEIDISRTLREPSLKFYFLSDTENKAFNPISIISNDVFVFLINRCLYMKPLFKKK